VRKAHVTQIYDTRQEMESCMGLRYKEKILPRIIKSSSSTGAGSAKTIKKNMEPTTKSPKEETNLRIYRRNKEWDEQEKNNCANDIDFFETSVLKKERRRQEFLSSHKHGGDLMNLSNKEIDAMIPDDFQYDDYLDSARRPSDQT